MKLNIEEHEKHEIFDFFVLFDVYKMIWTSVNLQGIEP